MLLISFVDTYDLFELCNIFNASSFVISTQLNAIRSRVICSGKSICSVNEVVEGENCRCTINLHKTPHKMQTDEIHFNNTQTHTLIYIYSFTYINTCKHSSSNTYIHKSVDFFYVDIDKVLL